jgi:hypothetical protein
MKTWILAAASFCVASAVLAQGHGYIQCECPDTKSFDARGYWSDSRIAAAKALPVPVLTEENRRKLMISDPALADVLDFERSASRIIGAPTPGAPQQADVSLSPHSLVGKLLFTKDGQDTYCTAQLVGDDSMILSAAHCVRDKNSGQLHNKMSFIAGYKDSLNRFSAVSCVGTWSTFPDLKVPNYAVDYAFLRLATKLDGHLGLKPRLPAAEWISVGYPKDISGGEIQQFVVGSKRGVHNYIVEMTENQMNGGASGGAFIANISGPVAVSVNSFRSGAFMYGPYFDGSMGTLYSTVMNGCPNPE